MSLTGYSPFGRSMNRAFDQMFGDDFFRGGACPYWARIPHERSLDLGSALGEVQNTPEKFAVSVDVSHFKPDEIQVNLNGNELTVEGRREKTTRRRLMSAELSRGESFVRKFVLPEDTNLDSLRSSLSDKGHLTIEAPKKTQDLTQPRAIHITRG